MTTRACRDAFRAVVRSPKDAAAKMALATELDACGHHDVALAYRFAALNHMHPSTVGSRGSTFVWQTDLMYQRLLENLDQIPKHHDGYGGIHRAFKRLASVLQVVGLMPQEMPS